MIRIQNALPSDCQESAHHRDPVLAVWICPLWAWTSMFQNLWCLESGTKIPILKWPEIHVWQPRVRSWKLSLGQILCLSWIREPGWTLIIDEIIQVQTLQIGMVSGYQMCGHGVVHSVYVLMSVGSVTISLLSFLILVICVLPPFLLSSARGILMLLIFLSKNQLLVLLIFSIDFLFLVSPISALILVSFFLLPLDLMCFFFFFFY